MPADRSARCDRLSALHLVILLILLGHITPLHAQTGAVEGTVRNAQTAATLAGARVTVVGTGLWAVTDANGYYRIDNVPLGARSLQATVLGFSAVTVTNARLAGGAPLVVNFELLPAVISLDAVVVTGVVGETQRVKLPFTVDQVKSEDLPVPQVDPLSALQGKVAGATVWRGSGRPGTAPTVLLRGATSLDAVGRSQEPLYIVDGVILGSGMVDIDALDIETIEVVKGAAAASLYGSRAGNGVVQITTRRGATLPAGDIRFSVRTELGGSQLSGRFDLSRHHQYLLAPDGSQFVDDQGNPCDWLECPNVVLAGQKAESGEQANQWNTYQTQSWPGTTYDQVDRFFTHGDFRQVHVQAEGRTGGTNFHVSYSNLHEAGIIVGYEGFLRNNVRVNLDQALGRTLQVGASMFYSRSAQDASEYYPLFHLTRMPAGVDLRQLNENPRLLPNGQVDSNDVILEVWPFGGSTNPLYETLNDDHVDERGRFLGSATIRLRPLAWLSLEGNVSYDRLDLATQDYTFKGYRTVDPYPDVNLGNLSRRHSFAEAFNASADLTLTHRFGDLATRAQLRYLAEWDQSEYTDAGGSRFLVADVPTFDALDPTRIHGSSGLEIVRADGYFAIANLDFKDRYILDALVRNDGSSLFGRDERRQWYYRIAGAWRASEDIRIPGVDELKLRYAHGTAGGRPGFAAQYETYSVSGGQIAPAILGNTKLKPERSTEQEAGIDLLLLGRVGLTVNYARTVTEDQILEVTLPSFGGFSYQWRNAGTLESSTWEAVLDLQLIQRRAVAWTARLLFDRTRQEITQLNEQPFRYGGFYFREGEAFGSLYGTRLATSCGDLLGFEGLDCDDFAVNDDGLLVWVGADGSLDDPQWGTAGPSFGFRGSIETLMWGSPLRGWGLDPVTGDTTNVLRVGKTTPDFNLGFSTSLRLGGLSVYGLIDWTQGFDVRNLPLMWAILEQTSGIMDQTGVPEDRQKPVGYYELLYNFGAGSSFFVQDASFVKLRELSVRYRFGRSQLAPIGLLGAFDAITVSLIGRNLITWTGYNGYDPETGVEDEHIGSSAILRADNFAYPNFRTFTAAIQLDF